MSKTGRSHLLRHTLPEIDVAEHFGTTDGKEIAKEIARMGQKELQVNCCEIWEMWYRQKL
jgi:ribosome maturation protein Sdo1